MGHPVLAIGAAGVAAWLFGSVWYGVLGKTYAQALGKNPDACKGQKMPLKPLILCLVAEWVMAAVLYHLMARMVLGGAAQGAMLGLTVGIGFPLMAILVNNSFQQRGRLLTLIDGLAWVLALTIEGAVIGALR
jgi:MFS family permease